MSIGAITPARPIGPPPGHALKWSLPAHIQYRVISPRNVQFVAGWTTVACAGCRAEVRERHMIGYRGQGLCPACFAVSAERDRAEAVARITLTARARAYLEREGVGRETVPDADLAYQNCPEEVP